MFLLSLVSIAWAGRISQHSLLISKDDYAVTVHALEPIRRDIVGFITIKPADRMYNDYYLPMGKSKKGKIFEEDINIFSERLQKVINNNQVEYYLQKIVGMETEERKGRILDEYIVQMATDFHCDLLDLAEVDEGYYIFASTAIKPLAIVLKVGSFWQYYMKDEVPYEISVGKKLGQPYQVVIDLALKKGYSPVCFFSDRIIFVSNSLSYRYSHINTDKKVLWDNYWKFGGEELDKRRKQERLEKKEYLDYEGDLFYFEK